jgi:ribonuclease HII
MRSNKLSKPEQVSLAWDTPGLLAGVDEAGRGPLAGPVVAAAVILDELKPIKGLADSKKLTAKTRERLFDEIRAKALCFAIAEASVEEIDRLNILQATMLAMQRAVEALRLKPTLVYVDGNRLPILDVRAEAIVKGDEKVQEISAASILAKVHRDRMCDDMHLQFPDYGFDAHKGYGTAVHLKALQTWGATPFHRKTFAPVTQAILAGKKISVYNYGKHRRDFTYIDDIVEGIVRVLDQPAQPNLVWNGAKPDPSSSLDPWRVYNIGNNSPVELMDYIGALEKALGRKAEMDLLPLQPGDVPDTYADVSDLVKQFNYKPSIPIEIGVTNFVSWYRDFFTKYLV